ncbi:MAG: Fe-S cluster assembly protein SufD, partial [Actinobacteria bacterium]|nr:Fe-S cluster assembly protein SufD [Actinomycetota bacterium]
MTTLTTNYLTPTGREEAWRFTPLKRLGGMHDGTAIVADRHSLALNSASVPGVSFALLSAMDNAPISESDDVIVARIRDFAKEVAVLTIAANTEVAEPILLKRTPGALDSAEFSRVLIRVENHARATVIIENTGDTHLAEDLEISVGSGASLTLVSLQEWG